MFNQKLKEQIKELQLRVIEYKEELKDSERFREENNMLQEANTKFVENIKKVTNKLREQNEADLFFAYHKAIDELKSGENKENISIHVENIERLRGQQGEMSLGRLQPMIGLTGNIFGQSYWTR